MITRNLIWCFVLACGFCWSPYYVFALDCRKISEINDEATNCSDNPQYTLAGQTCLASFEIEISKLTKKEIKEFSGTALEGVSKSDVDAVLDKSEKVKVALRGYRNNIFYPEEWDGPKEITGEDRVEFLNSHECYAIANKSLTEIERKLAEYRRILRAAARK